MPSPTDHPQSPVEPFLTFIVPVYNTEPSMLRECIDSLLAVQLADNEREVLVVDDGSDAPATRALLAELGPAVRVLTKAHEGVSLARNAGLAQARGEYVGFVDADDMLLPDRYDTCLACLRRHGPDVLAFVHDEKKSEKAFVQGEKKNEKSPAFREDVYETGAQYMLRNNVHGACWNYIVRTDVARLVDFPARVRYTEDERWTSLMLLRAGRTVSTAFPAYYYRLHTASATGNVSPEMNVQRMADALSTIVYLDAICATLKDTENDAFRRRVSQLTMDFIVNVWRWTHSFRTLRRQIGVLRERRLFPLPIKKYSRLYAAFSVLTRILFPF